MLEHVLGRFMNNVLIKHHREKIKFILFFILGFFAAGIFLGAFSVAGAKVNVDLRKFDDDVYPAIDVSHNPPLIAKADENVNLEFDFACRYIALGTACIPKATLYYTYGNNKDFTPAQLQSENRDSLRVLTASLPASNLDGLPLRYYLDVQDDEVHINIRYPVEGTVDLFVVNDFVSVKLPDTLVIVTKIVE